MIHIRNAHLSYGEQSLFEELNFACESNQKIGLLGRNGSGKSTLLKVLAGQKPLDEGSISIDKYLKIGYMPQEVVLKSNKSVYDELLTVSHAYQAMTYKKKELEERMVAEPHLVEEYAELLNTYTAHDVAMAEESAHKILTGLGFLPKMFSQPVSELSVGWKMRVILAQLLLSDADFYLFDEPTNHLDLPAKEWFFGFLKKGTFGFLLVTHDRYFLDNACDAILALENGSGIYFKGNYTQYIEAENQRRAILESSFNRQQKEIARKKETIERFKAKASKAKMAQSMIKQLGKIEVIELDPLEPNISFSFPPVVRSGDVAITLKDIAFSFESAQLFKQVSGTIRRGEKVALVAPNGTGKTTLFNILAGKYHLQEGSMQFGHKVTTAVFEQDQLRALDPNKTVFEEVSSAVDVPQSVIRTFLGSFLFSGDSISKKIEVLSGGERNRVAMVKVLLSKANFLLLDEPTNHLDLFAKEVLLQALQKYDGTMLFVSHDHQFVQELATRIWELTPTGLNDYLGTYEQYLEHKRSMEEPDAHQTGSGHQKKKKGEVIHKDSQSGKKMGALEKAIARCEDQLEALNKSFFELEYGTPAYDAAARSLKEMQSKLDSLTQEWERLATN